jgi:hypothetical protein
MHVLIAVCQRLDESTRQCKDWQEKILELMMNLSVGIDEKLRETLESTRALLCRSQRLQRYSQYCEDPEKGKEGRKLPEQSRPQGRFASRTASEGAIEYGRQLKRDAEDIFFPPNGEEVEDKRHHLKVKRKLDNCQRHSQSLPNDSPHTCKESQRPPLKGGREPRAEKT